MVVIRFQNASCIFSANLLQIVLDTAGGALKALDDQGGCYKKDTRDCCVDRQPDRQAAGLGAGRANVCPTGKMPWHG
jgi:hypothetical protein